MTLSMLQQLQEKQQQEELARKNQRGKERLQAIGTGGHTQWSGNIKELSNVTKVVESILDSKDLEKEYEHILDNLNVIRVDDLLNLRNGILKRYNNDVFFVRMFSKYTELLGKLAIDGTEKKLIKKSGSPVKFMDGI